MLDQLLMFFILSLATYVRFSDLTYLSTLRQHIPDFHPSFWAMHVISCQALASQCILSENNIRLVPSQWEPLSDYFVPINTSLLPIQVSGLLRQINVSQLRLVNLRQFILFAQLTLRSFISLILLADNHVGVRIFCVVILFVELLDNYAFPARLITFVLPFKCNLAPLYGVILPIGLSPICVNVSNRTTNRKLYP